VLAEPEEFTVDSGGKLWVSLKGYEQTIHRPLTKSGDVPSETWHIHVQPLKSVKLVGRFPKFTHEEQYGKFKATQALAGMALKRLLLQNNDLELETKLQYLTRDAELTLKKLSKRITLSYLANGWRKVVYLVELEHSNPSQPSYPFILKISKNSTRFVRESIQYLKEIDQATDQLIPNLGDVYRNQEHIVYFEEFIHGPSLEAIEKNSPLPNSLIHQLVRTVLTLYQVSGQVPNDLHAGNFMVSDFGSDTEHVVLIDVSKDFLTHPHEITGSLYIYYGLDSWVQDKKYPLSKIFLRFLALKEPVLPQAKSFKRDQLFFDASLSHLGEKKGMQFLEKAFQKMNLPRDSFLYFFQYHAWGSAKELRGTQLQGLLRTFKQNMVFVELANHFNHYRSKKVLQNL